MEHNVIQLANLERTQLNCISVAFSLHHSLLTVVEHRISEQVYHRATAALFPDLPLEYGTAMGECVQLVEQ